MYEESKRKKDTKGIFLAYPSGWMVVLFAMIENTVMREGEGDYEFDLIKVEEVSNR